MTKMKAQPSAINKICHHSRDFLTVVGASKPDTVGRGADVLVPDGVFASSLRHTPRPEITLVDCWQFAETHAPLRSTLSAPQERQAFAPLDEQVAQLPSQDEQVLADGSKNCALDPQAGKQRPEDRTGFAVGHAVHWLNAGPEQEPPQSG